MCRGDKGEPAEHSLELSAQGWQLATVSSGDHLQRCLEAYRELGIEVHTEVVEVKECGGCTRCFKDNEPVVRVYTRRRNDL
jgi:hypothetical protein